ncbi:MAG: hypothetical protein FJ295_18000 [Planctomycetes bacterium]|nr:hypothetical protein [Planctomycetota bacterium]
MNARFTVRFLLAVLLGWCLGGSPSVSLGASRLLAGAARREITPKDAVPMWGYGARHDALSQGTLDPLYATALVLQVDQVKLAIVGLDLGRSPSESTLERIRAKILERGGIAHAMIAGSHTHHGPVLELTDADGKGRGRFDAALRYYAELEDAIVDAILEANRALVPARFAAGGKLLDGFNRNRHARREPKPVDRFLGVMKFEDEQTGATIASLVNFTGHPTNLPAQTLLFSADYVGVVRAYIESELGGTAVFMQGASGDISVDRGNRGDHVDFGKALGREVVALARSLTAQSVSRAGLKVREERFQFRSRIDLKNPLLFTAYSIAFFPELVRNFADEYQDGIRPRLTVALLNEQIAIVGASGEFFCQHATRLRERARVEQLFFFGYCNGYHQYFPTIEAASEGGYGADQQVAPVEVGAGEALMNAALIWLFQMQGKL